MLSDNKEMDRDIETLARIGSALWVDPVYSQRSTLETLSAVSLLNLNEDRSVERACIALLEKARAKGVLTNAIHNARILGHPFFRLYPEERFLLVALHSGKWSYQRIGRILNLNLEEVQERVWKARLKVSPTRQYPTAPSQMGPHCPEYDYRRPWTQRFLDDEVPSGSDRLFLQNHLMACTACATSLRLTREVYFHVEKEVSKIVGSSDFVEALSGVMEHRPKNQSPLERTFLESLGIFIRRRDVALILLGSLLWVIFRMSVE